MTLKALKTKVDEIVAAELGADLDLSKYEVSAAADAKHGDVATNAAMMYAKQLGKAPRDVAAVLVPALKRLDGVASAEVAGPGFINITWTDEALGTQAGTAVAVKPQAYKDKVVVAEYGDPNPFKILHAGHLYTDIVGDAAANLIEASGGEVHRVNFGGDVGLHVGKAVWSILQRLGGENPQKLAEIVPTERSSWMTECYVAGNTAYEEDEEAKQEIIELNKRVYKLHDSGDRTSNFAKIYWTCRQWSYDYFAYFYDRLGSHFEKYYPESENATRGLMVVKEQLAKGVYVESDGAIVFPGEKYGLHTRVFITRDGLPTYETKDVGLVMAKWQDYHFDLSLIITANDQTDYMKVVVKSIEQFMPELANRTTHLTHGVLKLAGGVKMSSRKGNILRATDILDAAAAANAAVRGQDDPVTSVSAVKYAMLRARLGGDIVYDPAESVSLEGNSGPYLQYAHARARSILAKTSETGGSKAAVKTLETEERLLVRKIAEYPDIVERATDELLPHHICTYLYELAQIFNRFYESNRVMGDAREKTRLQLVEWYADVLGDGLHLLGIVAPDRL